MRTKLALAATLAGFAFAPAVQADDGRFYASIGGGLSAPSSSSMNFLRTNNAPHLTHTTFATGWTGLGAVGYQAAEGYRVELEGGYRQSRVAHMDAGTATGNRAVLSVMGNSLVDLYSNSAFRIYGGAGLGAAWVKLHNVQGTPSATLVGALPVFDDSSPPVFQYQAILGLNYPVSKAASVFAEYRYVGTTAAQFESAALAGARLTGDKPATHNMVVGFRFFLDGNSK